MTKNEFLPASVAAERTRAQIARTSFEDYLDIIAAEMENAIQNGKCDIIVGRCPNHLTDTILSFLQDKGYTANIYLVGGWTNTIHVRW